MRVGSGSAHVHLLTPVNRKISQDTDRATTKGRNYTDPFHGKLQSGERHYGVSWYFSIHHTVAVIGYQDALNPGDITGCYRYSLHTVPARLFFLDEAVAVIFELSD